MRTQALLLAALSGSFACSSASIGIDGSTVDDAGGADTGIADSGIADSGIADSGALPDAESPDAGPLPTQVELKTFVNAVLADPPWLAFREGGGAWQQLTGAQGQYVLPLSAPGAAYDIAIHCLGFGTSGLTQTVSFTATEVPALALSCADSVQAVRVQGNLSHIPPQHCYMISAGMTSLGGCADGAFSFQLLRGVTDFVVGLYPGSFTVPPDAFLIQRRIPIQGPITALNMDLDARVASEVHSLQTLGAPAPPLRAAFFTSAGGTRVPLRSLNMPGDGMGMVPSLAQEPDDMHELYAETSTIGWTATVMRFQKAPRDVVLDFTGITGLPTPQATLSISAGAGFLSAQVTPRAGASYYDLELDQAASVGRYSARISPAVLRASAMTFQQLDLRGAPGFDVAWAPAAVQTGAGWRLMETRAADPSLLHEGISGARLDGTGFSVLVHASTL
ncbi:MAG: hypothetical protein U1E65_02935 [Myxococcota bacterium]